ncbi:hypothetical protein [Aeoliella sp.]|uniref:hypothetical protein n=1 Tax=Aeoliella sp. TaxID=2795800 RepID=UPI003CCC0A42
MADRVSIPIFPVYPSLIAISFVIGWFIPGFYDWTGSDQSRASPLVAQTAIGLLVGAILIWIVLPWLPIAAGATTDKLPRPRFTSRTLLLVTAGIAIGVAVATRFPMVVSGLLCAMVFGYAIWFSIRSSRHRWPTAALLACMIGPYVWIVFHDELESLFPAILWMAAGLPAFLPAALLSSLWGHNLHEVTWLSVLLTAVELAIGIWLIRLGPRRTIAYLVLVLLMSTIGSFGLNALVRA